MRTARTATKPKFTTGTKFSRTSFGQIIGFNDGWNGPEGYEVVNEEGLRWVIGREIFEKECQVAVQTEEDAETLTQTALIEKIMASQRVAIVVNFNKQVDMNDAADAVNDLLDDARNGNTYTRTQLKKQLSQIMQGEARTLVGRHYGTCDARGRIQFTDMEVAPDGHRLRTVDPRTINWAVIDGVRYNVK